MDIDVNSELASIRSPICALAMPTTPSIGAVILVQLRLSFACSTAAFAAARPSPRPPIRLDGIVQFLPADGSLLGQRGITLHIQLRFQELGLRFRQISLSLIQCRLELAGIQFEQEIALLDERSFHVEPFHQIAGYLRRILALTNPSVVPTHSE